MRRHSLKDHEVAQLVNTLRDTAVAYHAHQSLRDRLSRVLQAVLNPVDQEQDVIPVRLPSGSKATVFLPRPFTSEDATHFVLFIAQYIEDKAKGEPAN